MFGRIFRRRFSERYFTNLFIILFVGRVVDSLIESDVSERIGNTTATLRLTRQKVLIQAIEKQGNRGDRGLTKGEQAIDNQDDYAPPDIVVEEFRIRAKINLQTRPKTCKDSFKDHPECNKSRIGSSSSRGDQNKKSFDVVGSSIRRSNQKSISSDGKPNFNGAAKNREKLINPDGRSKKTIKTSGWKEETNKRTKKWNRSINSGKKDFGKKRKTESTDDEAEVEDTKKLPFLETQNNDLEKPERLFISSDYEKKLNKRSAKNDEISQPCHGKSTLNVTNYSATSENESHEDHESHRRSRRSPKASNNSTTGPSNENRKKKMPKKSANANKKKGKSEKSSKKSESPKSSTRKTRNSTKTKTKLAKRSNMTIWDNAVPTAINSYFKFFATLLTPLIDAVSIVRKKNHSAPANNSSKFHWVLVPNNPKVNSSNSTRSRFSISSETNTTKNPSATKIQPRISTEIPSTTKIRPPISTEIRVSNSSGTIFKNSTLDRDEKTPEVRFQKAPEIRFENSTMKISSDFAATTLPTATKLSTNPVEVVENSPITEGTNINLQNSSLPTVVFNSKDSASVSTPRQTSDSPSTTERKVNETSTSPSNDSEAKLSEIAMSVMKISGNPAENFTTIPVDTTSERPGDYREKTTLLNFTIIDPNCTESVLLNSLRNDSTNQTSSIAEAISTYPTLRRYSRNDTVDEIAIRGNETSMVRTTTNSPNDSSSRSTVRRVHSVNRGRKRSRYKGKMQHPFSANSLPRANGKQSWRAQNKLSVTSISPLPTTTESILPTESLASLDLAENEMSTLSAGFGDDDAAEPSVTTVAIDAPDRRPILPNASIGRPDGPVNSTETPQNEKSGVSGAAKIIGNEISPRTTMIGISVGNETSVKKKSDVPTLVTETTTANFGYETQTETSFRAAESKPGIDVANEITRNKLAEVSIVADKSTSADSLIMNKIVNSVTKDAETKRDEDIESRKKENDTRNYEATGQNRGSNVVFRGSVGKEEIPLNSTPEVGRTESFAEKRLIISSQSTILPEKFGPPAPRITTEFYLPTMRRNEDKKMAADLNGKPEASVVSEEYRTTSSMENKKPEVISNVSSSSPENTTDVDVSSAGNPDIEAELISSKSETTDSAQIKIPIGKKTSVAEKLRRAARKARDTRNLAQYEDSQEPELDYDIDSFAPGETATKETQKTTEDNRQESKGASTPRDSAFTAALPHLAVHGVSFEEDPKPGEESTVIPFIHRHHDHQSPPVSTTVSNSRKISNEISGNFTSILEEPQLLALVKGLEDFLFDDSASGTSGRRAPKNQDLDVDSSNRNTQTRSAIFKTKRLSVNGKPGGKSEVKKNWSKRRSATSTTRRTTGVSSFGKRMRSRIDEKMIKMKKIKTKKNALKAGKAKIFKTQSATSKSRRASGKARNSTEFSSGKWKEQRVTRK